MLVADPVFECVLYERDKKKWRDLHVRQVVRYIYADVDGVRVAM